MRVWGLWRVLVVGSFGIPRLVDAMMVKVLRCGGTKMELQRSFR